MHTHCKSPKQTMQRGKNCPYRCQLYYNNNNKTRISLTLPSRDTHFSMFPFHEWLQEIARDLALFCFFDLFLLRGFQVSIDPL